jgi:hypothetical protein
VIPESYYAVTADGQRFLINEPGVDGIQAAEASSAGAVPKINVIVNWAAGLASD